MIFIKNFFFKFLIIKRLRKPTLFKCNETGFPPKKFNFNFLSSLKNNFSIRNRFFFDLPLKLNDPAEDENFKLPKASVTHKKVFIAEKEKRIEYKTTKPL